MLNNCGPSGSPPNSATLLGVIQGPLLVVFGNGDTCPICGKAPHALPETKASKEDAASLEEALKGAGFKARDIGMLAVASCQCRTYKAAARSTMMHSGKFSTAAAGYLTPEYKDYKNADAVIKKIEARTKDKAAFKEATGLANQRFIDFEALSDDARKKAPQVNEPGSCAAPRAILLLLEKDGLPGALTERWCGSDVMANPVEHFDDTSGERKRVTDRVFKKGDTVPPCLACDALLPLLLCDKDGPCHH